MVTKVIRSQYAPSVEKYGLGWSNLLWIDTTEGPGSLKYYNNATGEWELMSDSGTLPNLNNVDQELSVWYGSKDEFMNILYNQLSNPDVIYIVEKIGIFVGDKMITKPKYIYLDPVNGYDLNFGSEEYPVKTFEFAAVLSDYYGVGIFVMKDAVIENPTIHGLFSDGKNVIIRGGDVVLPKILSNVDVELQCTSAVMPVSMANSMIKCPTKTLIKFLSDAELVNSVIAGKVNVIGGSKLTAYNSNIIVDQIDSVTIHAYNSVVTVSESTVGCHFDFHHSATNIQSAATDNCVLVQVTTYGDSNVPQSNYGKTEFLSVSSYDFGLAEGSALIDKGNPAYAKTAVDKIGSPRLIGASVDIGAFEYLESKSVLSLGGKSGHIDTIPVSVVEDLSEELLSKANTKEVEAHFNDENNPHKVTKDQVGLGNVDNTSDANKPISTATAARFDETDKAIGNKADKSELEDHAKDVENPHQVTADQVGLGKVQNLTPEEMPVSTAVRSEFERVANEMSLKADLVDGKIRTDQIPDSLIGAVKYMGTWDAANNLPQLVNNQYQQDGWYYIAVTSGIQLGYEFEPGDWVINSAGTWAKVDNVDAVTSVNGKKGQVVLTIEDIGGLVVALSKKADDNAVVYLTNNQTITGIKTYAHPIVSSSVAEYDNQLPNLRQVRQIAESSGKVTSVCGKEGDITIEVEDIHGLPNALEERAEKSELLAHERNFENPHNVTKYQIGLDNVDNTSDANKPISLAQQAVNTQFTSDLASKVSQGEFSIHVADKNNPHNVTAEQLGLGHVVAFDPAVVEDIQEALELKADIDNVYTRDTLDARFSNIEQTLATGNEWKNSVSTYTAIFSTYPEPIVGWCVSCDDSGVVYRWNGVEWVNIFTTSVPVATEGNDGLMSTADKVKLNNIESGAQKNVEGYSSILVDGVPSNTASKVKDAIKFRSTKEITAKMNETGEVEFHLEEVSESENSSKLNGHPDTYFAVDAEVVHKTGDETIDGKKTFTGGVSVPEGLLDGDAVNLSQLSKVDGKIDNLGKVVEKKADLDSNGKILVEQIPSSIQGNQYKGTWNPNTNDPLLSQGDTTKHGWYYIVSENGEWEGITFSIGDWVLNSNGVWSRVATAPGVVSVNGMKGAVEITAAGINAFTKDEVLEILKGYVPTEGNTTIYGHISADSMSENGAGVAQVSEGHTDKLDNILNTLNGIDESTVTDPTSLVLLTCMKELVSIIKG